MTFWFSDFEIEKPETVKLSNFIQLVSWIKSGHCCHCPAHGRGNGPGGGFLLVTGLSLSCLLSSFTRGLLTPASVSPGPGQPPGRWTSQTSGHPMFV